MKRLASDLKARLETKPILLMTHLMLGYPDFATNREVIARMAENGVDCIELQIPFSEPIADGPVIARAAHAALRAGVKVADCLAFAAEMTAAKARQSATFFAAEMTAAHPNVHFLFMTYNNIVFKFGERAFLERCRDIGIKGTIIPDLPPEEGRTYGANSRQLGLAPIPFFTPTSTDARMREVAACGEGFVYCVARRGVTGTHTAIDAGIADYLARCRRATNLPLAVGFGIGCREDVRGLTGKADMAVIGTATIKLVEAEGAEAVGPYIRGLLEG